MNSSAFLSTSFESATCSSTTEFELSSSSSSSNLSRLRSSPLPELMELVRSLSDSLSELDSMMNFLPNEPLFSFLRGGGSGGRGLLDEWILVVEGGGGGRGLLDD